MMLYEMPYSERYKQKTFGKPGHLVRDLYERYGDEISRYLHGTMNGHADDADDIAQTVFVKLAAMPAPEDIKNPRAFLYATARNLVIDHARRGAVRNKRLAELSNDAIGRTREDISPEHIVLQRERLDVLRAEIEKLPRKRRRIFILNRVYGLGYDEIANEMGLSPLTVKKQVFRALKQCRAAMAKTFGEDETPSTPDRRI